MQWTQKEREFILALAGNAARYLGRGLILPPPWSPGRSLTDEDLKKAEEMGAKAAIAAKNAAAEVVEKKWSRTELATMRKRWEADDRQASLLLVFRAGLLQGRTTLAQELSQPEENIADENQLAQIMDEEVQRLKKRGQWVKLAGGPGEGKTDLVTLLNARSEEERQALFLKNIQKDSLSEGDWEQTYPVPDTWGGKGWAGPEGQRWASLKDIFDFYCKGLEALQKVAEEMAVNEKLVKNQADPDVFADSIEADPDVFADSIEVVDAMLSGVNLSLKGDPGTVTIKLTSTGVPSTEGTLFKGTFLVQAAVTLWAVWGHFVHWQLDRCGYQPCNKLFVRYREKQLYCSKSGSDNHWNENVR